MRGRFRISDWPLRVKLATAFLLPLLLVIAQVLAAYRTVVINRRAAGAVQHTYQVIAQANQTANDVVTLRDAFRSFQLTGSITYLPPYDQAKGEFAADLSELEELTADNPAQVRRWQNIGEVANSWISQIADPAIA